MVSIKDVARLAGVSVGTVSRVINDVPTVGEARRRRVERAIEALGYHPDAVAQSLRRRSSKSLGLLVPDITNPFFAELTRAVSRAASGHGYSLLLAVSDENPDTELLELKELAYRRVDGLVVSPTMYTKRLPANLGVPIVVLDRRLRGFDTISSDHEGGMQLLARYMADMGHVRIALISGPRGAAVSERRIKGWARVAVPILERSGIDARMYQVDEVFDYDGGYRATERLLRTHPRPTAIICSQDQQAIGAMRACADNGVEVPRDLSIVGYDGITLGGIVTPRLTTLAQNIGEIGRLAVERLLERKLSSAPTRPRHVVVATSLQVRHSSDRPPSEPPWAAS